MRLHALLVLVAAVVASAVAATGTSAASGSPGTALLAGIPQRGTVLGRPDAPATLIIWEDLGCSHCRRLMAAAFPTIVRKYVRPGTLKVDFRGLGVIQPASRPALLYALAAGRQNRLWHVVELFYEGQDRLAALVNDAAVRKLVRGVRGLDVNRLLRDAKAAGVRRQANATLAEANRLSVPGTPWFFFTMGNGPLMPVGPRALDGPSVAAMLDAALGR
jgi:protein-disulfide isomerase